MALRLSGIEDEILNGKSDGPTNDILPNVTEVIDSLYRYVRSLFQGIRKSVYSIRLCAYD